MIIPFLILLSTFNIQSNQKVSIPFELETDTYDAFGISEKVNDSTILHIYREGKYHVGTNSGRIVSRQYNINQKNWSEVNLVFDDPNLDDRNVAGGYEEVEKSIVLNITQYNSITKTFERSIVLKSNRDDFSNWTLTDTLFENSDPKVAFSAHGKIIPLTNGTLLQPWFIRYGLNPDKGPFKSAILASYDNGKTWESDYAIITESDSVFMGEPMINQINDSLILAVVRNNTLIKTNYPMYTYSSTDQGLTWNEHFTNVSGSGHILPYSYFDKKNNLLISAILDRGSNSLSLYSMSKNSLRNSIFGEFIYHYKIDSFHYNGYANFVELQNEYILIYAKSNSDNTNSNITTSIIEKSIFPQTLSLKREEEKLTISRILNGFEIRTKNFQFNSINIYSLGGKALYKNRFDFTNSILVENFHHYSGICIVTISNNDKDFISQKISWN